MPDHKIAAIINIIDQDIMVNKCWYSHGLTITLWYSTRGILEREIRGRGTS